MLTWLKITKMMKVYCPGDVVVIGGEEEIRKTQPGDEFIAVHLLNPAYLMNSEAEGMPSSINWSCKMLFCTG